MWLLWAEGVRILFDIEDSDLPSTASACARRAGGVGVPLSRPTGSGLGPALGSPRCSHCDSHSWSRQHSPERPDQAGSAQRRRSRRRGRGCRDPERAAGLCRCAGIPPGPREATRRSWRTPRWTLSKPAAERPPRPGGRSPRSAAGKHVLCEKPFAANAERPPRSLPSPTPPTGWSWRRSTTATTPSRPAWRRSSESGELGTLTEVTSSFSAPIWKPGGHPLRPPVAGGPSWTWGATPSRCSASSGGEPTTRRHRAAHPTRGVDRAMRARFTFPRGATGAIALLHVLGARSSISEPACAAPQRAPGGAQPVRPPGSAIAWRCAPLRGAGSSTCRAGRATTSSSTPSSPRCATARPVPTGTGDAVANMAVIDDVYRAAGMDPRRPTL